MHTSTYNTPVLFCAPHHEVATLPGCLPVCMHASFSSVTIPACHNMKSNGWLALIKQIAREAITTHFQGYATEHTRCSMEEPRGCCSVAEEASFVTDTRIRHDPITTHSRKFDAGHMRLCSMKEPRACRRASLWHLTSHALPSSIARLLASAVLNDPGVWQARSPRSPLRSSMRPSFSRVWRARIPLLKKDSPGACRVTQNQILEINGTPTLLRGRICRHMRGHPCKGTEPEMKRSHTS